MSDNVSDVGRVATETVIAVVTPDLCDEFPEVQVVEPGFRNFGAIDNFGGEIVTVKCFEDNSVVKQQIIYGCIRDADVIAKTALGVQALGTHPRKTEKRDVGDLNIAVTFGGVTFHPGHFVYADNNGIIVSEKALV